MNIGKTLKQKRLEKGLTQEEAAELILVSSKTISNWENDRTFPDTESLLKLADVYCFSLDNLLSRETDTMKESTKKQSIEEKLKAFISENRNLVKFICCVIIGWFFLVNYSDFFKILYQEGKEIGKSIADAWMAWRNN